MEKIYQLFLFIQAEYLRESKINALASAVADRGSWIRCLFDTGIRDRYKVRIRIRDSDPG